MQNKAEQMIITEDYSPDFKIVVDLSKAALVATMVWTLFQISWRKNGVRNISPEDFGGKSVSAEINLRSVLVKAYPLIERMATRFFLEMKDSGAESGEYTGEQFLHFMQDTYHLGPC